MVLVRRREAKSGACIAEMGIFAAFLGTGTTTLLNQPTGYLLRTKACVCVCVCVCDISRQFCLLLLLLGFLILNINLCIYVTRLIIIDYLPCRFLLCLFV